MSIDNDVGRVSQNLNVQESKGETGIQHEKERGKPNLEKTFGQKFVSRLGKDLGWLPVVLTGHFEHSRNLMESHDRMKAKLDNKPHRMEEIRSEKRGLDLQISEKKSEIATTLRSLIDEGKSMLSVNSKVDDIWKWCEERLGNKGKLESQDIRVLKKYAKDSGTGLDKELDAKLKEYDSLVSKRRELGKESRALDKITPGKVAGKAIRAGLAGIGSSLLTVLTSVIVAPFVPLLTVTSLARSTVYAATGSVPMGSPGDKIRDQLKDKAKVDQMQDNLKHMGF